MTNPQQGDALEADNRCHFGIEGIAGRCQNAATHRSEGIGPGEWFLWCSEHTVEFDEPIPAPPSAPTTEDDDG